MTATSTPPSLERMCTRTGAVGEGPSRVARNAFFSSSIKICPTWCGGAVAAASRSPASSTVGTATPALTAALPVDGDGVELCVMESVSPASNPRQTWSKAKQAAFDDEYAARPAAIYPYKRKHWFEVAFRDEPAVQKAPPFGSVPTDFRPEED